MSHRQKSVLIGLLSGVFALVAALLVWRSIPDFDSPRLLPVGQGFYLFGSHMYRDLLAEHSTTLFSLITPLMEPIGEPLGRQLFTLAHVAGTAALLAGAIGRRDIVAGLGSGLTFVLAPIVLVSSSMVTREPVATFWLLAMFLLLPSACASRSAPHVLVALGITALLAATSDVAAALCVLCLAIPAAWTARAEHKRSWLPAILLAGSASFALAVALPWSWSRIFLLFDARAYYGNDHVLYVGIALGTLVFPGSALILIWRLFGWSTGRLLGESPSPDPLVPDDQRHPFSTTTLAFALLIAQLISWFFIREPTWQATAYYLAPAVALLVGLQIHRIRGATWVRGVFGTLLLLLVIAPSIGPLSAILRMSPLERATFSVGWKSSQLEDRRAFVVAEGIAPHDGQIYFGPGIICSTECMALGRTPKYVQEESLAGTVGDNAVLVAQGSDIAQYPALLERLDLVMDEALGVVKLNDVVSKKVKKARWLIPLRSRAWRPIHETPAGALLRQTGTVDRTLPPP